MNSNRKQHSGHDIAVQERPAIAPSQADVDEIERFLREQFAVRPAGQNAEASDPLMAELARIVGQDVRPVPVAAPEMPRAHDPFAAPASFSQAAPDANDPLSAFEEELRRFDAAHRAPAPDHDMQAAPEVVAVEPVAGSADFDLHGATPASYDQAQPLPDLDFAPVLADRAIRMPEPELGGAYTSSPEPEGVIAEDLEPMAPPPAPRSRKVMMMLGGAAAIAVVGVLGSVAFGTKGPKSSGDVPVIAAKTQPAKEKPADPGGVEVPGQDRQVLARKTEEPKAAASVVTKEEQPVDLNQTPKREVSRVILAAPAQGTAPAAPIMMPQGSQPPAQAAAPVTAGGFEAKRVKSVKIGNDGETAAPAAAAAATAAPVVAAPVRPTGPSLVSAPPPAGVAAAAAKVEPPKAVAPKVEAPKSDARPATAPRPPQTAATTTPQPARVVPPRPAAPAPAAQEDGDSPMSLRPPTGSVASRPVRAAAATTPTASPAAASGSGGFSVQLAAPGSEAEARTVANRLKQRHASALDGYSPGVRKADVNGKSVYRVRVGGLSRDDANSLCTSIKADGGSCFVASN